MTTPSSGEDLATLKRAAVATLSGRALVSTTFSGATAFGTSSPNASATGGFDFQAARGSLTVVPSGGKTTIRIIFTPLSVLTRPAASTALPPGKSWFFADFSNPAQLSRNFPEFIAQVESTNPGLILNELSWGSTTATADGHDVVLGQATARYHVDVDLDQALRNASGPARVASALALQAQINEMDPHAASAPGHHSVIAHTWINGAGQLVRIELAAAAGLGTVTLTLSDFGASVPVASPPSNQIVAVASLGPSGERENNNGGDSDGG